MFFGLYEHPSLQFTCSKLNTFRCLHQLWETNIIFHVAPRILCNTRKIVLPDPQPLFGRPESFFGGLTTICWMTCNHSVAGPATMFWNICNHSLEAMQTNVGPLQTCFGKSATSCWETCNLVWGSRPSYIYIYICLEDLQP